MCVCMDAHVRGRKAGGGEQDVRSTVKSTSLLPPGSINFHNNLCIEFRTVPVTTRKYISSI